MMHDLTFTSHGVTCAAWHLPASTDAFAGEAGRPCIVLGHGFGGTRDTGLLAYAEAFAAAGIDAFVFDYRGFGASAGEPRQNVGFRRQRQDYHAAIDTARHLPGVDPGRIVLWGTSYSGGHVIAVAAQDKRVTAVVSMNPATDGFAALVQIARYAGVSQLVRAAGQPGTDCAMRRASSPADRRITCPSSRSRGRQRSSAHRAPRTPTSRSPGPPGATKSVRARPWKSD